MDTTSLWNACTAFHGHQCGGLAIGFQAALYAAHLLELPLGNALSPDEEIVCVTEHDACGVDGVQVVLGCTAGKGNLIFHLRGKQAFTFYRRDTGAAVRLVLRPRPEGLTRQQALDYYRTANPTDLFDVKPPLIPLPHRASLHENRDCFLCGESVATPWLAQWQGRPVCLDCLEKKANPAVSMVRP